MNRGGPRRSSRRRQLRALREYTWPGNVRELENVVQSLVVIAEGETVDVSDLPSLMRYSALRGGGSSAPWPRWRSSTSAPSSRASAATDRRRRASWGSTATRSANGFGPGFPRRARLGKISPPGRNATDSWFPISSLQASPTARSRPRNTPPAQAIGPFSASGANRLHSGKIEGRTVSAAGIGLAEEGGTRWSESPHFDNRSGAPHGVPPPCPAWRCGQCS